MGQARRSRLPGWARSLLVATGTLAVATAVGLWVPVLWPDLQVKARAFTLLAAVSSLIPGLLILAALLLGLGLSGLRRAGALAVVVALAVSWWVSEPPRAGGSPAAQSNFSVVTLNTNYGFADAHALERVALAAGADVVVLPEITIKTVARLGSPQWTARFPYVAGSVGGDWVDTGLRVYSRYPLTVLRTSPVAGVALSVRVHRPGAPVVVVATHLSNPRVDWPEWLADFSWLADTARGITGPLVVVGDFNAVPEHLPFERLLVDADLSDATGVLGRRWSPTFPSPRSYPTSARLDVPFLQIDHVLVGGSVRVHSLSSFRVDGTDHRGLVGELWVPPS